MMTLERATAPAVVRRSPVREGWIPLTVSIEGPATLALSELGDRVLVIAAHPDDEVLAAGGTLHALRARGVSARIILLTAGDGYLRAARRLGRFVPDAAAYLRLGDVRFAESVGAAGVLGIPPSDVACLGYPDGRLTAMLDAPAEAAAGRSGSSVVPYSWAHRPGAPCAGDELAADLTLLIRDYAPTAVIHPDARDTHADHAAAASFVDDALERCGFEGVRLSFLVHFGHYPYPWAYRPAGTMRPPRALRTSGSHWLSVPLDAADIGGKESALRAFPSQNAIPDLRYFMRAFVRSNELFSRSPSRIAP